MTPSFAVPSLHTMDAEKPMRTIPTPAATRCGRRPAPPALIPAAEKYLPVLHEASSSYEAAHPHWRIEVLVSLIKWSLRSLQHYLEDTRDTEITWESPFVELHYPVEWNWQPRGKGDVAPGGHIFGNITKQNTATQAAATRTLARIMTHWFNATALADATNWAWYEKVNDYYTPVLPIELSEQLHAIKRKSARREAFEELVRPFAIGAARIDLDVAKLKSGARVPKQVIQQLDRMDIGGIRFTGEVNGRKFDMGLVFEIHPLMADYDQKKAYHPITVGLAVLNGNARLVGGELVQDTPAEWPKRDRQEFWEGLLREMDQLTGLLIPQTESQESVILSVNAQLKVPAEWWRPENRSALLKGILDAQAQAGEVVGISVQPAGSPPAIPPPAACAVCGWQHDAGFTQVRLDEVEVVCLRGVLPDIVALVHRAHENGFPSLSTKDEKLLRVCGGYRHPCKAFDDLKQQVAYKQLFDTSRRGFISLRGAVGRNRNKSEARPE